MELSLLTLGLVAVFAASLVLALTVSAIVTERRQVNRQLRQVEAWAVSGANVRARELAAPVGARVVLPAFRRLASRLRRYAPSGILEQLGHQLELAGSPEGWDAERVFAAKIVAGIGVALLALVTGGLMGAGLIRTVLLVAFGGLLGQYVPDLVLRSRVQTRQARIQQDLPDSLDLLSITVEAGLGFDAALSHVATQFDGPIGQEYNRLLKEMQLGKTRADALRDLAERSTVPELRSFVLAMVQADAFGISVSQVLRVQAEEMRVKRHQRAEERAQKLPVKILFPLIACVFPSLFIVLLGPAGIRMYDAIISR